MSGAFRDEWSALSQELEEAGAALRKIDEAVYSGQSTRLADRRAGTRAWWAVIAKVADRGVADAMSSAAPSELALPLRMLERIAADLARGRIPEIVSHVAQIGNIAPAALERDVDYATVYLLACRPGGFENRWGVLEVDDPRRNRTVATWFGVSWETARKWSRRTITHEVVHSQDPDAFSEQVRYRGRQYAWNRLAAEGGGDFGNSAPAHGDNET